MRVLVWNMAGGFEGTPKAHERCWRYLHKRRDEFDVALLQEAAEPPEWASDVWASIVWTPKPGRRSPLWGSAVIARERILEPYRPTKSYPWLGYLAGSVTIARSELNPQWWASIHSRHARLSSDQQARHSIEGIPLCAPKRGVWEIDLIAHELGRLFKGKTSLWGGDLNTARAMDEKPWFSGCQQLFDNIVEAGFCDLRLRFSAKERRTYFKEGNDPYQLDHVFADPTTEGRVTAWRVNPRPAQGPSPYSDHAPIRVTLN